MGTYRINTQDGEKGIEKYLEGVYGRFDGNAEAAAKRFEGVLGIPVHTEDVDLIFTCEALAAEQSEFESKVHVGSGYRIRTQGFRDAIAQMRVDTEKELRSEVVEWETAGFSHAEAVRQTLVQAGDPRKLRRRVVKAGNCWCKEQTIDIIVRKNSRQVRTGVYAVFILFMAAVIFMAMSHVVLHNSLVMPVFGVCAFLVAAVDSYADPIRRLKSSLLSALAELVTRKPFINATSKQQFRFSSFKQRSYPEVRPLLSAGFLGFFAAALVLGYLYETRPAAYGVYVGLFCLTCSRAGAYFGQGLWNHIDRIIWDRAVWDAT